MKLYESSGNILCIRWYEKSLKPSILKTAWSTFMNQFSVDGHCKITGQFVFSHQLFKGKFFVCQGESVQNITNKSECLQASYKWVRHKYNFDNLGQVRFPISKSINKCFVELLRNYIFTSISVYVLLSHCFFPFSVSGLDVSVCSGIKRRLGGHYVWWSGRCRSWHTG